jgi:hypothetical protein
VGGSTFDIGGGLRVFAAIPIVFFSSFGLMIRFFAWSA